MTYGVVGAILLAVLAFMVWKGHAGIAGSVVALLLGFVIATGNGVVHGATNAAISGIQHAGNALADAIGNGGK
jgi:hypothetical protein